MKRRGSHFQMVEGKSGVPFIDARDESLIILMCANSDVIIEPSAAFEQDVLLLPCGSDESAKSAAETTTRELQEEVGCNAARLGFLGAVRPGSKYLRGCSHIYLGRGLRESRAAGDGSMPSSGSPCHWHDTPRLIVEGGAIRDARVIIALQLLQPYLENETA